MAAPSGPPVGENIRARMRYPSSAVVPSQATTNRPFGAVPIARSNTLSMSGLTSVGGPRACPVAENRERYGNTELVFTSYPIQATVNPPSALKPTNGRSTVWNGWRVAVLTGIGLPAGL